MTKRPYFPRLPLFGIFALLGFSVVAALIGRATHAGAYRPNAAPVAERDLLFFDRADGAVLVEAPIDHQIVHVFQGEQGFLRGTLRGFARTRHLAGLGPDTPFRLTRWSDGRLTLDDAATGEHVELMAFGPSNSGVFAPLLEGTP
jgi:putative photosynthetic complex assembly protein